MMSSRFLSPAMTAARSRRKENVVEKCVDAKNKTLKVVDAKSYNYDMESDVWVITHVGRFTRR